MWTTLPARQTADMEDVMQRVINNLRSTEPPEDEEERKKTRFWWPTT
ncbi:MAG: hypothetical protein ACLT8C_04590 [Akkermansia muciniphila]